MKHKLPISPRTETARGGGHHHQYFYSWGVWASVFLQLRPFESPIFTAAGSTRAERRIGARFRKDMERQRNKELYGTRKKPKHAGARPSDGTPTTDAQAGIGRARMRSSPPLSERAPPPEAAL